MFKHKKAKIIYIFSFFYQLKKKVEFQIISQIDCPIPVRSQTHQIKTHVHTIKNRNFPKNHPKMTDTVEEKVVNRKRKMSKGK